LFNNNRRTTRQRCRLVTARTLITSDTPDVNAELENLFSDLVQQLLCTVNDDSKDGRALELAVWALLLPLGRALLQLVLTLRCLRVAREAAGDRQVSWRLDDDYSLTQSTTLGAVTVPIFAFRDGAATHSPARSEVFPLHPKCRSSMLLLEWEARTGSILPFRQAEEAMAFYTHGAMRVEDTTISRHMGVVGRLLDITWTCKTAAEVRDALTRAQRDKATGKPVIYFASDAHALRRYTDDTWNAEYKMINGIRVWCVDRSTGRTVHLGGAYTWGDCREVAALLRRIVATVLPGDAVDDYQVVFLSDGIDWIRNHLVPVMPVGTVVILDAYHVMEHLGVYAAARFGKGTCAAKRWLSRRLEPLLGKRASRRPTRTLRTGHKKRARPRRPQVTAHLSTNPHGAGEELSWLLVEEEPDSDALRAMLGYLIANADRCDYPAYRARGLQVGSGAMESFHRVASQMRLKAAGTRWRASRALAVLNTSLLWLAGRWEAFWSRGGAEAALRDAFNGDVVLTP
jgi:hypothetical protein